MSASEINVEAEGWRADLRLRFATRGERTHLVERAHVGPLIVQRPFYPEGGPCHVYLVHPPGGIVGGDDLALHVTVDPAAHVLLTTPAAGKFYRSSGAVARQRQTFRTQAGTLEWLPQESIFYPGAQVRSHTRVELDATSRFIGWEIGCLGLPSSQEAFNVGRLHLGLELHIDDVPRWIDRLRIDGDGTARNAQWGLAGYTAIGTMLVYPGDSDLLELVRQTSFAEVELATTCVDQVLVCRAMAGQAEPIRHAFIQVWQLVRPRLLHRPAMSPRIWRT